MPTTTWGCRGGRAGSELPLLLREQQWMRPAEGEGGASCPRRLSCHWPLSPGRSRALCSKPSPPCVQCISAVYSPPRSQWSSPPVSTGTLLGPYWWQSSSRSWANKWWWWGYKALGLRLAPASQRLFCTVCPLLCKREGRYCAQSGAAGGKLSHSHAHVHITHTPYNNHTHTRWLTKRLRHSDKLERHLHVTNEG